MLTCSLLAACLQYLPHSEPAQESLIQPPVQIPLRTQVSTPIRLLSSCCSDWNRQIFAEKGMICWPIGLNMFNWLKIKVAMGCARWADVLINSLDTLLLPTGMAWPFPRSPRRKSQCKSFGDLRVKDNADSGSNSGTIATGFGVAAGLFAVFFFGEVPRVRKDVLQKLPFFDKYLDRSIPPEDNVSCQSYAALWRSPLVRYWFYE